MLKTLLATIDFPPQFGGVANYWANLIRFLPNNEIVVLAPEYDESLGFDVRQNYLIYRKELLSKNQWLWPKWLPLLIEMYRVVRLENIRRVVVTHVLPAGTAAYLIKKLLHVPYIVSLHGLDLTGPLKSKWKHWLVKTILSSAEGLIVNSEFTKKLLKKYDERFLAKVSIIYPCPNVNFTARTESKMNDFFTVNELTEKKIILTVGRLIERKGQDKVIEAMPKILEKFPDSVYLIVGQGERLDYLKNKIKELGLTDKIKLFCDTLDAELPLFYQAANLFVMPCRELDNGDVEGFGIVFLEANVYSKPVIAGKSGGASEAVEHGVSGLLVDPQDVGVISATIISLLADKDRAQVLGENGRRRVEEKFNWEIQAKKLIKILQS